MKIAYSHLVNHIKENPSIETLSENLFQLGHEHEIEKGVFNIEFTPNRGDCLSINGLLRDLSVFYNVKLNQKKYDEKLDNLNIKFQNLSQDICPQISFLKLEIDNIPDAYNGDLNNYFLELNVNKNNFFTDISNYISYETGQPTHCYDANKINGKLVFQELEIDQEFETLTGKKINITNKNPVFLIEDEIINLAGVMGGMNTACSSETKIVLIECAFFEPEAIIGKSIKYDIQSEASHKYERFVDPECHETVLRRFINIVNEHTNIIDMSVVHYKYKDTKTVKIPVNVDKINQIIGTNINESQYLSDLSKLGFVEDNGLIVVPSYRSDIKNQNDLAEEIARVIGYNNIPKNPLRIPKGKSSYNYDKENKLRYFLLDHGFYEVINFPFIAKKSDESIKVDNPLDSNRRYLRTNITNSLIDNLIYNEKRQSDSIKLFEISDIYSLVNNEIKKTRKLSIIASGRVGNNHEDFSKKINIEYMANLFSKFFPRENFDFKLLNRDLLNSKIKNEIIISELDIDDISDEVLKYEEIVKPPKNFIKYIPTSDLPCSKRDLSFSIRDITDCRSLEASMLNFKDKLLKEVFVFDYYFNEKKNEIKMGFRFVFQSHAHTITDKEVDDVMELIVNNALKYASVSIPGLPFK